MSYYKRRKIKDGLDFLEDKGFKGTGNVDVARMAEELDVGEIPTELQIQRIVRNLEEKSNIPYSDPNFKAFRVYQKQGVRYPEEIGSKTEQWKRKRRYLNERIDEVKIILQEEGFYRLDDFNPSTIQVVPTNRQIYNMIDELKDAETVTRLPNFLQRLENAGVVIPSDIRVKIAAGTSAPDDYASLYEEATMGVISNLDDYFDLATGNPDEVEINGQTITTTQMKNEIMSHMRDRIIDVPRGNRFLNDYYNQMDIVNGMTNNQIIALFGIYDTGLFLNDLTDYDSEGDSINTKGMKSLLDDITRALTF